MENEDGATATEIPFGEGGALPLDPPQPIRTPQARMASPAGIAMLR
jgi:hypothetical protein